jgi:hypothetical protein
VLSATWTVQRVTRSSALKILKGRVRVAGTCCPARRWGCQGRQGVAPPMAVMWLWHRGAPVVLLAVASLLPESLCAVRAILLHHPAPHLRCPLPSTCAGCRASLRLSVHQAGSSAGGSGGHGAGQGTVASSHGALHEPVRIVAAGARLLALRKLYSPCALPPWSIELRNCFVRVLVLDVHGVHCAVTVVLCSIHS